MKAESYFETSGNNEPSTQRNKPEGLNPQTHGVRAVMRKYTFFPRQKNSAGFLQMLVTYLPT